MVAPSCGALSHCAVVQWYFAPYTGSHVMLSTEPIDGRKEAFFEIDDESGI